MGIALMASRLILVVILDLLGGGVSLHIYQWWCGNLVAHGTPGFAS